MADVATITLEDASGKTCTVKVSDVTDGIDGAKKIADWMKTHSDARVVGYGISRPYSGDKASEGKYDQVAQKLTFIMKDSSSRKVIRLSLPAPRDEDLTTKQQAKQSVIDDVVKLIKDRTGKTVVPRGGYLLSRHPGALDVE